MVFINQFKYWLMKNYDNYLFCFSSGVLELVEVDSFYPMCRSKDSNSVRFGSKHFLWTGPSCWSSDSDLPKICSSSWAEFLFVAGALTQGPFLFWVALSLAQSQSFLLPIVSYRVYCFCLFVFLFFSLKDKNSH